MMNIDREHPEYAAKKAMWKKYKDLYEVDPKDEATS